MNLRHYCAVIALVLCCAPIAGAQQKRKPATHTVTIDAVSFKPATLTIKAGDSVVWVNKDVVTHTATAEGAGGFESGALASGASWKHTFKGKADFAYLCRFHPTMKGRLVVE